MATDQFVYGTGDRNVIETLRYSAFVQARDLTAPEKRHLLRHEVDVHWHLVALWCDLHPDLQAGDE